MKLPRGRCSRCRQDIALRTNGTVRDHNATKHTHCFGSGNLPADAEAVHFVRREAMRMRERGEGADAAVAAHFEILASQLERGEHFA